MSDVSLLATQLATTSKCGEELDNALLCLKKGKNGLGDSNYVKAKETAKLMLSDLLAIINGKLPTQYQLREETIEILKELHRTDWQEYSDKLRKVSSQLAQPDEVLIDEQLHCVEDVARAIDTECSMLFQRMQGRHR